MSAIPQEILIARALSALESAEILLKASTGMRYRETRDGLTKSALIDLEKGMNLLREVLG